MSELGSGVTLGAFLVRGRLAGSSGLVELRYAGVTTWTDGLIDWVTTYFDIDEARAAAERLAKERRKTVSQENVDLVLTCVAAYNEGDMDAWAECFDAGVEAIPDAGFIESEPLLGLERYRVWTEEQRGMLPGTRWQTTEVHDLGNGRVTHRGDWGGTGRASAIQTSTNITGLLTVRGGKITCVEFYFDHDRAVNAAGLEA
jgi:ketosteroid isomerase-like protein